MKIGKLSESTLKRAILKTIKYRDRKRTKVACNVGIDASKLDVSDWNEMLISTETVTGPIDKMYNRAIIRACNNVHAAGGIVESVSFAFILPEYVKEKHIRQIMDALADYCKEYEIIISGGHTEVSMYVTEPVVTVTAYGRTVEDLSYKKVEPGMDIVMSKAIGLEATILLAEKEELKERFSPSYIERGKKYIDYLDIRSEAAVAIKHGVAAMHDVSESGIFGALWEMGEAGNFGLSVNLKDINVYQETIEFCEYYNYNPYIISSGGCLLMVTNDGEGLVEKLEEAEIPAFVIGKVTDVKDKVIVNEDENRYLEPPRGSVNL